MNQILTASGGSLQEELGAGVEPSYTVVGNIPLVLRESLLEEVYKIGENFVHAGEWLVSPGMPGPFCLEGVYDSKGEFTTFEFSEGLWQERTSTYTAHLTLDCYMTSL